MHIFEGCDNSEEKRATNGVVLPNNLEVDNSRIFKPSIIWLTDLTI